jgi:hypothetical protein
VLEETDRQARIRALTILTTDAPLTARSAPPTPPSDGWQDVEVDGELLQWRVDALEALVNARLGWAPPTPPSDGWQDVEVDGELLQWRVATLEALVKARLGDLAEVEKFNPQVRSVVEGRKKGAAKSLKVRQQKKEDWMSYAGPRIRDLLTDEPDLTKHEVITRLTDKKEPWPHGLRRRRSTLEKAKGLWPEVKITPRKRN